MSIEGPRPTVISQEVTEGGTHLRTRVRGEMPGIGLPYDGWSGPETVSEKPRALRTFDVVDPKTPETPHQAFERVVGRAVQNTLVMGAIGDDTNETYLEAVADMRILRDEWDRHFNGSLELIVHDRIQRLEDLSVPEVPA